MKGLLSKRKPVVRAFWENACGGDCLEPTVYGTNWDFLLLPFLPVGVAQEKAKCAVRLWELLGHPGALSADIYFVFAVIYVAVRNSKIVTVPKKWKYIKPKKELNVFLCGHPFKCQGHTPHSSTHEKEERQTPGDLHKVSKNFFINFLFPPPLPPRPYLDSCWPWTQTIFLSCLGPQNVRTVRVHNYAWLGRSFLVNIGKTMKKYYRHVYIY